MSFKLIYASFYDFVHYDIASGNMIVYVSALDGDHTCTQNEYLNRSVWKGV